MVIDSPVLYALFLANKIVFVNNMLCINNEKYIQYDKDGFHSMTRYALDHADECCLVFKRERKYNRTYDDSYGNLGFLCREISASFFVEASNDITTKVCELNDIQKNELKKAANGAAEIVKVIKDLPGSFAKTLDFHIKRKGLTALELSQRSQLSTQSISNIRNGKVKEIKLRTLMKLCIGLNLAPPYCRDLMNKARVDFPLDTMEGLIFMKLAMCHTDETLEQWQKFIDGFDSVKINLYDEEQGEENKKNKAEREKKKKVHKFQRTN